MDGTVLIIGGILIALGAVVFMASKNDPIANPPVIQLPIPDVIPEPVPPPPIQHPRRNEYPTSPYWKMEHGTWNEYTVKTFKGKLDRATGVITVDSWVLRGDCNRVTNLPLYQPGTPDQLSTIRQHTPCGIEATVPNPTLEGALLEGYGWVGDREVIGESGNFGVKNIYPPEPLVTVNPVYGETIDLVSDLTNEDGKFLGKFKTQYKTISVDDTTLVTFLLENAGEPGQEYAYYHIFDGELLEIRYGQVAPDGTIDEGLIAFRTKSGKNN